MILDFSRCTTPKDVEKVYKTKGSALRRRLTLLKRKWEHLNERTKKEGE